MRIILRSFAAMGFIAAAEPGLADGEVDLVLLNGEVITVDDQFSVVQAVAVSGKQIAAVGDSETIRAMSGPETRIIDLEGRTVIPGLIDTHSHVMRASQLWKYEVRFDGVTDRDEALARLRAKAATLEDGDWLLNFGGWVEDQFLDDPRGFTLDELDRIAPDHPVFLDVNYNHRYVNGAFLDLAGIPLLDPEAERAGADGGGGLFSEPSGYTEAMIERDEAGRATGKILGGAAGFVPAMRLFPTLGPDEAVESLEMIVEDAVAKGLTAIYDGGGFGIRDAAYDRARRLAEQGALRMRVFHSKFLTAASPAEAEQAADAIGELRAFSGDDYYGLLGIGESVYVPALDNFGEPASDTPETRRALGTLLGRAAERGLNVQQHMVHPKTMNMTLDVIDTLAERHSIKPLRWIVIHADLIDRPTLERMRRYNMTPSLRTHFMLGSVRYAQVKALYGAQARRIPPFRTVQDSGVSWAFGSEAPRINVLNPLMSLAFAVTGKRFYDLERVIESTVTREEALIAHTRHAAWQISQDQALGQIAPGYLADMVILDRDYLGVPEDELFDIAPVMTLVGGDIVFEADTR